MLLRGNASDEHTALNQYLCFLNLTDKCLYDGAQYSQGQSWPVGDDVMCHCEDAVQGYYRCTHL